MEKFMDFLAANSTLFLLITVILVFALIGYIVEGRRSKSDLFKKTENELDEISIQNIQMQENKSFKDVVSSSKNINKDTRSVELTDVELLDKN